MEDNIREKYPLKYGKILWSVIKILKKLKGRTDARISRTIKYVISNTGWANEVDDILKDKKTKGGKSRKKKKKRVGKRKREKQKRELGKRIV